MLDYLQSVMLCKSKGKVDHSWSHSSATILWRLNSMVESLFYTL